MSNTNTPLRTPAHNHKKRQDTPHPYYPNPPRIPTGPKFDDEIPDSLDIAIAVAKAGTTGEIADKITKVIDKLSPARRRNIRHQLETNPSAFYRLINVPNVVQRTIRSAERIVPKPKTTQPTQAPTHNAVEALKPVFIELLNHSKISNVFLKELLTHQRAQTAAVSTSSDPRKQPYLASDNYSDLWAQLGVQTKDDVEMADATEPIETADAQAQTEDWLGEEPPVPIDGPQATDAN